MWQVQEWQVQEWRVQVWRVREPVFGVLALESEPVDRRLQSIG
ncbi:MAG: hypothetical protein ACR2I1_02900 [Propionibacteriaceae bacterium]